MLFCTTPTQLSLSYSSALESLSDRRMKLSKKVLTKFVMMTVASMTSQFYNQNVTYPYLIDCGTLQRILPHPAVQSALSRLSITVCCTISVFSFSFSCCILIQHAAQQLLFHDFTSLQYTVTLHTCCLLGLFMFCLFVCLFVTTVLIQPYGYYTSMNLLILAYLVIYLLTCLLNYLLTFLLTYLLLADSVAVTVDSMAVSADS